jgi:hypothetical protein
MGLSDESGPSESVYIPWAAMAAPTELDRKGGRGQATTDAIHDSFHCPSVFATTPFEFQNTLQVLPTKTR